MVVKCKVALVTGAAAGIGLAIAKQFLKCGAKGVALADVNQCAAKKVMEDLACDFGEDRILFVKLDVGSQEQFVQAFEKTYCKFKQLDILVNNAGIINEENYLQAVRTNLGGVANGTNLALNKYITKYKKGPEGYIVNIASITGLQAFQSIPIYSATKAGVISLTKALGTCLHYTRTKVKVLGVLPGVTTTAMVEKPKPPYEDLWQKDFGELPTQPPDCVAKAVMVALKEGKNGSLWVAEGKENAYEVQIPDRKSMKKPDPKKEEEEK